MSVGFVEPGLFAETTHRDAEAAAAVCGLNVALTALDGRPRTSDPPSPDAGRRAPGPPLREGGSTSPAYAPTCRTSTSGGGGQPLREGGPCETAVLKPMADTGRCWCDNVLVALLLAAPHLPRPAAPTRGPCPPPTRRSSPSLRAWEDDGTWANADPDGLGIGPGN